MVPRQVASPMAGGIIAKECVEKFGDLKKAEAVIGTGPLDARQLQAERRITLVRNPQLLRGRACRTSTGSR